jgi:hypothetical protein
VGIGAAANSTGRTTGWQPKRAIEAYDRPSIRSIAPVIRMVCQRTMLTTISTVPTGMSTTAQSSDHDRTTTRFWAKW